MISLIPINKKLNSIKRLFTDDRRNSLVKNSWHFSIKNNSFDFLAVSFDIFFRKVSFCLTLVTIFSKKIQF